MKKILWSLLCINSCFGQILITGGAGFIGSHLAQALLDQGEQIALVDSFNDYYDPQIKRENVALLAQHKNARLMQVYEESITNPEAFDAIIQQVKPTVIVHLAAYAGVRYSIENPRIYYDTNVMGTFNVYESAVKHKVSKVVMASSSSVYGDETRVPFLESYACNTPKSPYAVTKKMSEIIAYQYYTVHGMRSICLRFFTVYGPRGRRDMAPFIFLDKVFRGAEIVQYGDGSSLRDFTYVSDIVNGIVAAIRADLKFEVLNLGRGEPVRLSEFIQAIEQVTQKKARIKIAVMPQGDVERTHASITRSQALLGYAPKVSLIEGLTRTFEWYQNSLAS